MPSPKFKDPIVGRCQNVTVEKKFEKKLVVLVKILAVDTARSMLAEGGEL